MNRKEDLAYECMRLHYSIKNHVKVTKVTDMKEKIKSKSTKFSLSLIEVKNL